MIDRNKTALTHRVTALAAAYLEGIGCKPVETEVEVRPGWFADVASYWYPTRTELKRLKLHRRIREKVLLHGGRGAKGQESEADLWLRVAGSGPFTVVVEVKTTRGDFAKDRKWSRDPPAHFCFVAYPRGAIRESDLPAGWFGLECSKAGTRLLRLVNTWPLPHPQLPGRVVDFIAQVGIRRDHRTRWRAQRDWAKAYRAQQRDSRQEAIPGRNLQRVCQWLRGEGPYAYAPVKRLLQALGIRESPKYLAESVEWLEGLKRSISSKSTKPLTPNP